MIKQKPLAIFYAGTNGSGKSSLRQINDKNIQYSITRKLNTNNVQSTDIEIGREAIREFKKVIHEKIPFSMETTLTGKSFLKRIEETKFAGFEIELHYVGLDNVEENIKRVAFRFKNGGHYINENLIRKRYDESLENLQKVIFIFDKVFIFDNSGKSHSLEMMIQNGIITKANKITPNWILKIEKNFLNLIAS